jgi:hypothetical protein
MRRVPFVNYADELPYFRDEVMPRLERMGVRGAARSPHRAPSSDTRCGESLSHGAAVPD